MDDLLDQIDLGIQNNLYYLSLLAALALPDICGALESANGQADRNKYIKWFDKHIGVPKRYFLNGADCYYFRCAMLHQGSTMHKNSSFKRILFVEPGINTNTFHNNILNDALNIDVKIFCTDLTNEARAWLITILSNANFIKNYKNFIKRHPNGFPPYINGICVIT